MKTKTQFLSGLLVIATLALFTLPVHALDFITGEITADSTLLVTSNTTASSTSVTPIEIPPNTDILLLPSIISSGTGTSNTTYSFNVSGDGTRYSTTYPITTTAVANTGTTRATGATFISRTNLIGVRYLRWDRVTTAQLANVTNKLYYSFLR